MDLEVFAEFRPDTSQQFDLTLGCQPIVLQTECQLENVVFCALIVSILADQCLARSTQISYYYTNTRSSIWNRRNALDANIGHGDGTYCKAEGIHAVGGLC